MFDPPEILYATEPSETFQGSRICLRNISPEVTKELADQGIQTVSTEANYKAEMFLQMIAKIGHAYAVAEFGVDGFRHCVTDLIRGRSWKRPP